MTARAPLVLGADGLPQQVQAGDTLAPASWDDYATQWSATPTKVGTATSPVAGAVYSYTLSGTTRYRLVPAAYNPTKDAFYSAWDGTSTVSGLIVSRG